MRTFEDAAGRRWDAAVSTASYGSQLLIFAVRGGEELRACELELYSHFEAEQWLLGITEPELRQMLAQAPTWQPG